MGNARDEVYNSTSQKIMSRSQGEVQSIQAYVREAEQLSKHIPVNKDPILAVAVIRSLRDNTRRHGVSFTIRGKRTSFTEVSDLTKTAYFSVGDSDPFRVGKDRSHLNNTSPYYACCLQPPRSSPPP